MLKKGCAHYCNQTITVSLGRPVLSGDPGHFLIVWGIPKLG